MRTTPESADRPTSVQRALTWAVFLAAASVVAALCVAMLRPFANVVAWSAILAIFCYPLQQRLVRRTGRVALSAFITSVLTMLACVVPLLAPGGIAVNEGVALGHSLPRGFQAEGEPLTRAAELLARISAHVGLADAREPPVQTFAIGGLTPEQVSAVDAGRPVAKVLSWGTPSEVYVFGAVHVEAASDVYLKGEDGVLLNADTKVAFTMKDPCVELGPHVGYHEGATAGVRADVRQFLTEVFKLKQVRDN